MAGKNIARLEEIHGESRQSQEDALYLPKETDAPESYQ